MYTNNYNKNHILLRVLSGKIEKSYHAGLHDHTKQLRHRHSHRFGLWSDLSVYQCASVYQCGSVYQCAVCSVQCVVCVVPSAVCLAETDTGASLYCPLQSLHSAFRNPHTYIGISVDCGHTTMWATR
jgi:hypothetical protein